MDIFSLLKMIGGLSLFLYGMNEMGSGLVSLSGSRLEKILSKLTSSKIKAILLGCLVTSIIQSSSATTVMVVGFVNSGLMNLSQAVGVIMGANIGTTITSWILSLSGISGSSFFIKMLKPTSFSPILSLIGIFLLNSKKKDSFKNIGTILLGFSILMFGIDTMSQSVAPLAQNESFTSILLLFSNPIIGMIVGALLTAIIQSSSASVGILQALCVTGSIRFSNALPIIMGQNIGTCVTAIISSFGASINAKRASLIHLYFNVIGTISFMVIFYSLNFIFNFSFINNVIGQGDIAIIHTAFNIVSTVFLLPFSNLLVKLTQRSIKDKENNNKDYPKELLALDERFLDIPEYSLNLSKEAANEMARLSFECLRDSLSLMDNYNLDTIKEIKEKENMTDIFEDKIGAYLIKLSRKDLSEADSNYLNMILHNLNDLERIGDHSLNVLEAFETLNNAKLKFSDFSKEDINILSKAIKDILQKTLKVFITLDKNEAKNIEVLEEIIDDLKIEIKQRHIRRLTLSKSNFEQGLILEDLITDLERVSDHCLSIAKSIISLGSNDYDLHSNKFKKEDFLEEYNKVKEIYILPEL